MKFYQKYIPEGQTIHGIIHQHWTVVIKSYILWLIFGAFIPSFLYFQSERIQDIVPFFVLEILLGIIFLKIVYELFNWYNDVWIITEQAVYDLEWSLFKTNLESLHHDNIEGIEIDKHRFWDAIFRKGDIIIHKFGEEELAILNASDPYKSVGILEEFIHPQEEEEDTDKFDMIMDALSGVVSEHLKNHGIDSHSIQEPSEKIPQKPYYDERYTLDLGNEK